MNLDENQIAKGKAAQAEKAASKAEQESVRAIQNATMAIRKAKKAEDIAKIAQDPSTFALREAREAIALGERARIEAEDSRSKAELARIEAETARGKAEQSRSLAENMRTQAEAVRSSKEAERVKAEESRHLALEAKLKAEQALQSAIEAKEQARLAEERYRLVIEGSDDGLWDWDIEKGTVYWNGRFFQMLGIDNTMKAPTEVELIEHLHPDDEQRLRDTIERALNNPSHFSDKFRIRTINGHYIHCRMKGKTILNKRGQAIRMAGMITNVTQQIESQEQLQQYALQLEQSNRDLEQFAAIASHDMQAPLRKVKIFAEKLEKEIKDTLKPESLDDLHRMQRSIASMQQLIADLLSYSKVSQGQKMLSLAPVDLSTVIQRGHAALEDEIEQKKATIEIGPLLCQVKGDPVLLTQLFQNILQNALKYQPPERQPQIRIAATTAENGCCQISVEDNGIGFDAKDAERIFGVFERLHNKGSYSGTGIGLAICRRIAERHNGSIRAESKNAEGAQFIIQLPIA